MEGLIAISVIILMRHNNKKYIKIRVFKLKFINEIKNKFGKLYKALKIIIKMLCLYNR